MRALAVVHPLPSSINATVVAVLALVAGAGPTVAVLLAVAMLGFQVSIGCFNDVADEAVDRDARPDKPIPAGMVSRRTALAIAFAGGAAGLVISAGFGIIVLLLGAAGYASGLAYDFVLRRIGWAWLAYALALPLLLLWTWQAAAGTLPPAWPFILPLAAVAGPALHLANSLVDVATDERTAVPSLAIRLGATRARWTLVALSCGISRPRLGRPPREGIATVEHPADWRDRDGRGRDRVGPGVESGTPRARSELGPPGHRPGTHGHGPDRGVRLRRWLRAPAARPVERTRECRRA